MSCGGGLVDLVLSNSGMGTYLPPYASLAREKCKYQRTDPKSRFPKSANLDRFLFYQGLSHFKDADFAISTPLFEQFLKDFPKSYLYEHSLYHLAMSHFLNDEKEQTMAACEEYLTKYPDGLYAQELKAKFP